MTVTPNDARIQYTAVGGELTFDYDFPIEASTHLVVDLDGTTLTEGADYNVTGVGASSGGQINLIGSFSGGATAAQIWTLFRDVPNERLSDFQFEGDLRAVTVNAELDSLVQQVQDVVRDVSRSLTLTVEASDTINPTVPVASALKLLRWNAAATDLENVDAASVGLGVASDVDPLKLGTKVPGTSQDYSRTDHVHPSETDKMDFAVSVLLGRLEGRIEYDPATSTFVGYDDIAGTALNFGNEVRVRIRNKSGGTLSDGKVVYIDGSNAQLPTARLAKSDDRATAEIVGVVTADILDNAEGWVTILGDVNGIDTSAHLDGAAVWLSPTTAGEFTSTKPTGANYVVEVGHISNSHATQGKLLVHPSYPLDQSDITNVDATFATLTALKASTNVNVGEKNSTIGYLVEGDGGDNSYKIVAAATGVDDGLNFIDLPGSGHQAQGLFPGGEVRVEQGGAVATATDTAQTAAIQAAIDSSFIVLNFPGQYETDGTLNITGSDFTTFLGRGSAQFNGTTSADYDGVQSRIKWTGAAGGKMVSVGTSVNCKFQGIVFDDNNGLADIGIEINQGAAQVEISRDMFVGFDEAITENFTTDTSTGTYLLEIFLNGFTQGRKWCVDLVKPNSGKFRENTFFVLNPDVAADAGCLRIGRTVGGVPHDGPSQFSGWGNNFESGVTDSQIHLVRGTNFNFENSRFEGTAGVTLQAFKLSEAGNAVNAINGLNIRGNYILNGRFLVQAETGITGVQIEGNWINLTAPTSFAIVSLPFISFGITGADAIISATQANPVVLGITAHSFSDGDLISVSNVVGMTQLNGGQYLVANQATNTIELTDLAGNNIDGTGFTAYTSGGNAYLTAGANNKLGINTFGGNGPSSAFDGDRSYGFKQMDQGVTPADVVLSPSTGFQAIRSEVSIRHFAQTPIKTKKIKATATCLNATGGGVTSLTSFRLTKFDGATWNQVGSVHRVGVSAEPTLYSGVAWEWLDAEQEDQVEYRLEVSTNANTTATIWAGASITIEELDEEWTRT